MKLSKTMARLLAELYGSNFGGISRPPLPKVAVRAKSLEHRAALELVDNGLAVVTGDKSNIYVERAIK